jgi:hypothetical protein
MHKMTEPTREVLKSFETEQWMESKNELGPVLEAIKLFRTGTYPERTKFFLDLEKLEKVEVFKDSSNVKNPKATLLDVYEHMVKDAHAHPEGKRRVLVEKYGYDIKYAYNVVRLILEAEQIMMTGDIDLQRDKEQLKSIRRGEWTVDEIRDWFADKEKGMEKLYEKCELPWGPDESNIKRHLLNCLEMHYGDIQDAVVEQERPIQVLREIAVLMETVRNQL